MVYEQPEMFGLDENACLAYDKEERPMSTPKELAEKMKKLRKRILTAAESGELSVAQHIGQVLKNLRTGISETSRLGKNDNFVTPWMFQQVFAFSTASKEQQPLCGDTQEDAREYFEALVNQVAMERPFLQDSFKWEQRNEVRCSAEACGHTRLMAMPNGLVWTAKVPRSFTNRPATCSLRQVLQLSLKVMENDALEGYKCQCCGKTDTSTQRHTFSKLPENLAVHLDRVAGVDEKILTAVDPGYGKQITFGGEQYTVRSVIRHLSRGSSTTRGHYTTVQGGHYTLDDKVVKEISANMCAAQDGRHGHCCRVLLKRVASEG